MQPHQVEMATKMVVVGSNYYEYVVKGKGEYERIEKEYLEKYESWEDGNVVCILFNVSV